MTRPDDCGSVRSQNSTPPGVDMVTVDRKTLKQVLVLLAECSIHFEYLADNDIFVFATKRYLADLDCEESRKALNLLSPWTDTWPDAKDEVGYYLDESQTLIKSVLDNANKTT
jgi:hypothetical protein